MTQTIFQIFYLVGKGAIGQTQARFMAGCAELPSMDGVCLVFYNSIKRGQKLKS